MMLDPKDNDSFSLEKQGQKDNLAYVKAVIIDGQKAQAVFSSDGTPLAIMTEREIAFATLRQYDMEPISVH